MTLWFSFTSSTPAKKKKQESLIQKQNNIGSHKNCRYKWKLTAYNVTTLLLPSTAPLVVGSNPTKDHKSHSTVFTWTYCVEFFKLIWYGHKEYPHTNQFVDHKSLMCLSDPLYEIISAVCFYRWRIFEAKNLKPFFIHTIIALTMSDWLFFKARTALALDTLACDITISTSLSSTPVSSAPSSSSSSAIGATVYRENKK